MKAIHWLMLFGSFVLLIGCQSNQITVKQPGKLLIYTSLYPLEDFTKKIGGKYVQTVNLVPPGIEPHDFEVSAKQMAGLQEADLVVFNGGGFESWAAKAKQTSINPDRWIETSKGLPMLASAHEHEGQDKEDEHQQEFDPHLWLDPTLAKKQAQQIEQALIRIDPQHAAEYRNNMKQLVHRFDRLDQTFQRTISKAKNKKIVVSHAAFSYLAHRYQLEQIAVTGLSPSSEPSAKELEQIIQTMHKHQLKYIFFETLVHPKVAKTIQREAKAIPLTLNPLEGLTKAELNKRADYFSIMEQNRVNLVKALESE